MDHSRDIKELLQQSRQNEKLDRERSEAFEALMRHAGWSYYKELLSTMIEQQGTALLEPMRGRESERVKGTMHGLLLARDLPSITVATMNAARDAAEEALEDEEDAA